MLSIPTILGGSVLEGFKHIVKEPQNAFDIPIGLLIVAFLASFGVGLLAIRYIFSITSNEKLQPFAIYLLLLSVVSFIYLNY